MRFELIKKAGTGSKYYRVTDDDGCMARVRVSDHPIQFNRRPGIGFCIDAATASKPSRLRRELKKIIKLVHKRRNPKK